LHGHFVDRRAELAMLRAQLDQARSGRPRVVLVSGPAGIGKTALLDRFLHQETDVRVLRASGDEAEAMLGYGVVDQLLRLGGASGSTVLATHNGERPGPPALVEGHLKVGAQILALLGALQDEGPVLLVGRRALGGCGVAQGAAVRAAPPGRRSGPDPDRRP
jgi:AAA ATPase domain